MTPLILNLENTNDLKIEAEIQRIEEIYQIIYNGCLQMIRIWIYFIFYVSPHCSHFKIAKSSNFHNESTSLWLKEPKIYF